MCWHKWVLAPKSLRAKLGLPQDTLPRFSSFQIQEGQLQASTSQWAPYITRNYLDLAFDLHL